MAESQQVRELLKSNLQKRKATTDDNLAKKARLEQEIDQQKYNSIIDKEYELFQEELKELEPVPEPKVVKRTELELLEQASEITNFEQLEEQTKLSSAFKVLKARRTRIPKIQQKRRPRLWSKSDESSE